MFFHECFMHSFLLLWLSYTYNFGYYNVWFILNSLAWVNLVYGLLYYDYDYWKKHDVVTPKYLPFVGHIFNAAILQEQIGITFKKIYDNYQNERFVGTHQFYQRTLVVRDPELIRSMCVNDFSHFVDRGFFFNKDVDPLAASILFLRGNEWRRLRSKLTPIFSPNKLRNMLPIIEKTADEFVHKIGILVKEKPIKINNNLKEDDSSMVQAEQLLGGFTADAIVPCAFGLKSNVMDNPRDPFAVALQAFYEMSLYNVFEKTMRQFWPAFVLFFGMRIIPQKTHDFFTNAVYSVLRSREAGLEPKRGDFIDHMMALRYQDNVQCKEDTDNVEITDMVISANAFIIFLGGFETTSSTLTFLLLELADHPHIQMKLRHEIVTVLHKYNGKITYDMMNELVYMEKVIKETLRLYPPFPNIQRICTKDYQIPKSKTIIEKGTIVLFPTLGIHRDSKYFKNPDDFIPERFDENAECSQTPTGVYMPFGDGPRYCIGKRFAWIQMKTCLVKLLSKCSVSPVPNKQHRTGPHEADPRAAITLHPKNSDLIISFPPRL